MLVQHSEKQEQGSRTPHLAYNEAALVDFFLKQVDIYAGASDSTLQRLRYVRDAVFVKSWTTEQAVRDALDRRAALTPGSPEDASALQTFAIDMRLEPFRQ